jgi:hypothetical protein
MVAQTPFLNISGSNFERHSLNSYQFFQFINSNQPSYFKYFIIIQTNKQTNIISFSYYSICAPAETNKLSVNNMQFLPASHKVFPKFII